MTPLIAPTVTTVMPFRVFGVVPFMFASIPPKRANYTPTQQCHECGYGPENQ
jgi:hypothetical protein